MQLSNAKPVIKRHRANDQKLVANAVAIVPTIAIMQHNVSAGTRPR